MKKMKFLLRGLFLFSTVILMTSSVPIKEAATEDLKEKEVKANMLISEAKKTGNNLTSKDLINIATEIKGEKLTFKEKLSLKLFNKKLNKLNQQSSWGGNGKSQLVALLLVLFVGGIGIHRFYLGYTWQGVVQIFTLGGFGVWTLIDLIRIITGDLAPKDGAYGSTL